MIQKISQKQANHYKNNGYLILKNCIDKKNFHNFDNRVIEIVNRELNNKNIDIKKNLVINEGIKFFSKNHPEISSKIYRTINRSYFFLRFIQDKKIANLAAQLIETKINNLSCINPVFRFDVPGDKLHARLWHQESNYFKDVSNGSDGVVCWIPMNKAYAKNGSVILAAGSHKGGYIPGNFISGNKKKSEQHKISEKKIKRFKKKIVHADIGDLVFINFHLVHSSGKNVSQFVRCTAQIRYTRNDREDYNPPNLSLKYGA